MKTLLLRLAAPLQSYGEASKFDNRMTMREPTKSAVIGLLAAAQGRKRDASLDDLCALRYGVRIDQEGQLLRDLHTAKGKKSAYLTNRYYLEDAIFLVGLEGEEEMLQELDDALHHPAFPLFLGRRACPPTLPLSLGIRSCDLEAALREEPWLVPEWNRRHLDHMLRIVTDSQNTMYGRQRDLPLSFSSRNRKMAYRSIQDAYIVMDMEHDPMSELGGERDVSQQDGA